MNPFNINPQVNLSPSSSNPTAADAARIDSTSPITTVAQGALATSLSTEFSQALENSEIYQGEYNEQGLKHGQGTLKYANGDVYEGMFREGKVHGQGTFKFTEGDVYEGEFSEDIFHGQGTMKFSNGNVYKGVFRESKPHGQGTLKFANGDVYEGEFSEDKCQGKGTFNYANGNAYEGQFSEDTFHGQGTLKWANGSVYEGQFRKNLRTGKGKLTYANGRVYEGLFKEGKFYSKGKWIELPDPATIESKKQINAPSSASSSKSVAPEKKQSPLKKEDPVKKVSQPSPPPQKAAAKSPESAQEPARNSAKAVSVLSSTVKVAPSPFSSGATESPAVKPMTKNEKKKLLAAAEGKEKTRGQARISTPTPPQGEPPLPASSTDSYEEKIVQVEDESDVNRFLNDLEKGFPILFKEERRKGSHRILVYTVNEREFKIPLLELHGGQEKFALGTGKNIGKALARLQKAAEEYAETLQIVELNRKIESRREQSKPITSEEVTQRVMGSRVPSGAAKAIKLVQKVKKVFRKK